MHQVDKKYNWSKCQITLDPHIGQHMSLSCDNSFKTDLQYHWEVGAVFTLHYISAGPMAFHTTAKSMSLTKMTLSQIQPLIQHKITCRLFHENLITARK